MLCRIVIIMIAPLLLDKRGVLYYHGPLTTKLDLSHAIQERDFPLRRSEMRKWIVGLTICTVIGLLLYWVVDADKTSRENFVRDVKANTIEGVLITAIYPIDTATVLIKGDPTGGAIVGGGLAAAVGFGPLGIIFGAAIGADASKDQVRLLHDEALYLMIDRGLDTALIRVKDSWIIQEQGIRVSRQDSPTEFQMYGILQPGVRLRIVSEAPLSRLASVYTTQIYLPGERIPFVDP